MARASEQMKTIKDDLERVQSQIATLQIEEGVLKRLLARLSGEPEVTSAAPRKRSASVKPLVLDIIHEAGADGMSSADVAAKVRESVPDVAKDTVGSVLSRLKSEGAFVYENERYYEKQHAPRPPEGWRNFNVVN